MNHEMPVKTKPYRHQQGAFDFACGIFGTSKMEQIGSGVALLMEMGCGKTLVSIAIAGWLYLLGLIDRVLIVAPLSIMGVWEAEFAKHADFPYNLTILQGSTKQKTKQLSALPSKGLQIVIINYESVWRLANELTDYDAELIIADEGHKIKNGRAKQSDAMHQLGDNAQYKLLLTGTLFTGKELDVFSQYRFLDPEVFGSSFSAFRDRYFKMGGHDDRIPIFRQCMQEDFLENVHSIAYRITKAECLDLPEITEETRIVDLEHRAAGIYSNLELECHSELDKSEVTTPIILTKLLRLLQITGGHVTDDEKNVNTVSTAKLDALSDIIDTAMAENKKLVIMARFVHELDDIQELLTKKMIGYAAVRGSTKNRDSEIHRFQTNDTCRVFVGQIATAGHGITLTAASTMIFFSYDYSMTNFDQAKARIHRVGQTNNCHYIYLVCRDTIDCKVLQALRQKLDLAQMLMDDYRAGRNPFK